ncbi:MAG: hypothetical protein COC00_011045 [Rhizobiales bacterium]|nr:hypothetical protein [Hyphomicrobiales bacterium]
MRAEADNASVLELYAAFVRMRPRDADYDTHVKETVPIVTRKLAEEIQSDGQLGACVDVAQMLNKILEELGIWSYSVQGSLTIMDPSLPNPTCFWMFDEKPVPGHVWVVAPPFDIIDVTLKAQPYGRHEADLLPLVLTSEGGKRIRPSSEEFFEPSLLAAAYRAVGGPRDTIHERTNPGMMSAINFFPSWQLEEGTTRLRYATGGISLSDAPDLPAIKNRTWNGRYASAVLDDIIRPALDAILTKRS